MSGMAGRVLPKLRVPKGMKHLKDPRDLLTPEQQRGLQKHLSELARLRRRVETESAWIPMH